MNRACRMGLGLFFTLLFAAGAEAQVRGGQLFWKYTMTDGSTYEVALRSITSVSIQNYLVDGGIQITELAIDTTGNTEARFYFMQSAAQASAAASGGPAATAAEAAESRAQDVAARAGSLPGGAAVANAANAMVVKNYPSTTHAHTVEFRVAGAADITAIFNSIETAWKNNANGTYPPPASNSGS